MEAYINEWGPIMEYDDSSFRNYYLFHSGITNNNSFSTFYDQLMSSNIKSYNDITNLKGKTQFLLKLTQALQGFAVSNNLKIVTYVGEASSWFDITANTDKIKSKIVNKIGKLIKTLTAQGILIPPSPAFPENPDSNSVNVSKYDKKSVLAANGLNCQILFRPPYPTINHLIHYSYLHLLFPP